jgi:hypothetical protein
MEQKRKWTIPLSKGDLAEMGQRAALDLSLFGVAKSAIGDGFVEVLDPRGLRAGDPGVVMAPAPRPWTSLARLTGRKGAMTDAALLAVVK